MSRREFIGGVAAAAMSSGRALGSAERADHRAPPREETANGFADVDGEEYTARSLTTGSAGVAPQNDPTAYARQLLATLDTLTPKERREFRKLAELDRRDAPAWAIRDPSGLGEP